MFIGSCIICIWYKCNADWYVKQVVNKYLRNTEVLYEFNSIIIEEFSLISISQRNYFVLVIEWNLRR